MPATIHDRQRRSGRAHKGSTAGLQASVRCNPERSTLRRLRRIRGAVGGPGLQRGDRGGSQERARSPGVGTPSATGSARTLPYPAPPGARAGHAPRRRLAIMSTLSDTCASTSSPPAQPGDRAGGHGAAAPVPLKEAAGRLGVSVATLRRWIREGRLHTERVRRPQGYTVLVHLPLHGQVIEAGVVVLIEISTTTPTGSD